MLIPICEDHVVLSVSATDVLLLQECVYFGEIEKEKPLSEKPSDPPISTVFVVVSVFVVVLDFVSAFPSVTVSFLEK